MAYQALYRTWRPLKFSDVVGQEAVVKTLQNQIESGRIAHAYLLCGCRGTGKTTIARIMSRAINCPDAQHGEPCGKCDFCRAVLSESTLDVVELDAASNNSVDNVRELLEQVRYPAQLGKYKVYIIDEVHMLSGAAFNALLKTLEEPPAHVVFILATTEPQKLPATILSRVQRYDFGRIPARLIIQRLRTALGPTGLQAEDEALQLIARAAEGAMRDALSILDMCVSGAQGGIITAAQLRDVLGASDKAFLFSFADCLIGGDTAGVMRHIDQLMRDGREPQVFLKELTSHLRALMTVKTVGEEAGELLEMTDEDVKRLSGQAQSAPEGKLLRMAELFMRAEGELRYASSPRVGLEVAALRACLPPTGESGAALMERVETLEKELSTLHAAIRSGALAPAAAAKPAPKAAQEEAPAAKPAPKRAEPPKSEAEAWSRMLDQLKKTDPAMFGLLRNERFLGAKGNVYQLEIPIAKRASYDKLSEAKRKDRFSALLTEITGAPAVFEAVLAVDSAAQKRDAQTDKAQQQLIDAFGRDVVQVDEGNEEH